MTRDEIVRRIATTALLRGSFTLRSGRTSDYYLDKYLFSTEPELLRALGEMFAARLPPEATRLAGAELGGIPLVTAASLASGLPSIFVRSAKKAYGTGKQLEGRLERGDKIVLVEDVATTGGQVLEAAAVITEAGGTIIRIIATVDRREGAAENIAAAGYPFESLFAVDELLAAAGPAPAPCAPARAAERRQAR